MIQAGEKEGIHLETTEENAPSSSVRTLPLPVAPVEAVEPEETMSMLVLMPGPSRRSTSRPCMLHQSACCQAAR